MQISQTLGAAPLQQTSCPAPGKAAGKTADAQSAKPEACPQDSLLVSTGRGVAKTFYGTILGTGAGVVSFYTPLARPFAHAGAPKIMALPAMMSGVVSGVVAGHMADSPGKAAAYGALGGAVTGAFFGYGAGSVATAISGALVGAVSGSVSGLVTAGVFPAK